MDKLYCPMIPWTTVPAVVSRGNRDHKWNVIKHLQIAKNAINNMERPSYLCRTINQKWFNECFYNQTLCGYEKISNFEPLFSYFLYELKCSKV